MGRGAEAGRAAPAMATPLGPGPSPESGGRAAPQAKRAKYSWDPDLEVEVEGRVFQVHSFVLMAASPVFRGMLTAGMKEGREGRVALAGKRSEEFAVVLQHLDTAGGGEPPEVEHEHLEILLRWADEYQMEMLRARIERVLLQQRADDVSALKVAVDFGLSERRRQCVEAISKNISKHLFSLQRHVDDASILEGLWPAIFRAAGIHEPTEPITGSPRLAVVWPLIVKACTGEQSEPFRSADEIDPGMRVQIIRDVKRLKALCRAVGWEAGMQNCAGHVGEVLARDADGDLCVKVELQKGGPREYFFPFTALLRPPPGV